MHVHPGTLIRCHAAIFVILATALLWSPSTSRAQGSSGSDSDTLASPIEWPGFETAIEAASESGKIVLIDIFSPHCGWCRKLQSEIYTQPHVQEYVNEHFELGRLDITVYSDSVAYRGYEMSQAAMAASFGSRGTPTTIFLESNGDYITRLPGFHETAEFMAVLRYIGSRAYEDQTFEEYLSAISGD
ncbi:MAG: thioredoxin fold domain-containing protein [Rhodothermales bacterium]|nr:thioredoxin fold domain-containing protein [Rhodothermales bacterium]